MKVLSNILATLVLGAMAVNGLYIPQINNSFIGSIIQEGERMLEDHTDLHIYLDFALNPVHFYLYTNKNPTMAQNLNESSEIIKKSNFDAGMPTKFFIHGWTQSFTREYNKKICAAWLANGKCNVIFVDWDRARQINYIDSVVNVPKVGVKIASFIDYLVENHGVNLDNIEVIGHSLGAHIAGFTGKNLKSGKLPVIIGLDPALPLYSYEKRNERLNEDDAKYVESIHTNGGILGFLEPIGKIAFYPNGGQSQPGCGMNFVCSHLRAAYLYAEAVALNDFRSVWCSNYEAATEKKCGTKCSNVKMGAKSNAEMAKGVYYVPVNSEPPYGMGA